MHTSNKQQIEIKRIYEAAEKSDGYRVLVDRIWPRGVSKDAAALDEWNKDVAPSTELRKWFDHKVEKFDEFAQRYQAELADNPAVDGLLQTAKKHKLTLLYAAHDPALNQAVVLAKFLRHALHAG
jgi:uncharacterized protein YeaO (DUF488 family)